MGVFLPWIMNFLGEGFGSLGSGGRIEKVFTENPTGLPGFLGMWGLGA
jgi:hypothetical protein